MPRFLNPDDVSYGVPSISGYLIALGSAVAAVGEAVGVGPALGLTAEQWAAIGVLATLVTNFGRQLQAALKPDLAVLEAASATLVTSPADYGSFGAAAANCELDADQ